MNQFRNSAFLLAGAGYVAASLAISANAFADSGIGYVKDAAPKPWIVLSNGQEYTKLDHKGMLTILARLEYDTEVGGGVKGWWAYPAVTNGYGIAAPVPGMDAYKQSKSYSVGNRPDVIGKNLVFSIPVSKFNSAAVGMCNFLANKLRNEGKSNKQIFSKNREVSFSAWLKYDVDASGAGSGNPILQGTGSHQIKVRCQKWSGPAIDTVNELTTEFRVIKATMKHKMITTLGGACKVRLTTAISTNAANKTVKFRYKSQSGKKSQVFTTKTKGNKIAVVTHTWNVSNAPSIFDGTWIHMQGVSPSFKSNTVAAFTECKEGGPTGLKPNPKKPKVAVPLGGKNKLVSQTGTQSKKKRKKRRKKKKKN